MITVELCNLLFNAFHGIHEEEKILGNEYVVNTAVEFKEHDEVIGRIADTVNYSILFQLIKKRMEIPTPLLETLVMEMGMEIHRVYPKAKSITLSIEKRHPPLEGMQGSAKVRWYKKYE